MSLLLTSLLWLVLHCMLALTSVGSCATVALPLAPYTQKHNTNMHSGVNFRLAALQP